MSLTAAPPTALPPRARRGRRGNRGLGICLVVLLIGGGLALGATRYYAWCGDASGPRRPVRVSIAEGASGADVVSELHRAGVIRCDTVSRWLLRRSGLASRIRAGTYELTTNMEPEAAFAAITKVPTPVPTVDLTIPPGYRLTQIAAAVQETLGIAAKRFLAAAAGSWSLPPYLPAGKPLEGLLFPDTYRFAARGTTADEVIRTLLDGFATKAAALPWQDAKALGESPYDIVVIASMIEREAAVERDRPLIAAVIYNRLRAGMRLGIDATLVYVDPTPGNGLTESDLKIRSPYNTRTHTGLPPTPIASPGLASLEAALQPAHVDYLYYVLCGSDGHHVFSSSYARFLRDKQRCLG